jgi:superfamily II DNA or RNA helicase
MDYSFQKGIIKTVKQNLISNDNVILSACVGAGKTEMANKVMKKYAKVLVLAHNQDILRSQFAKTARNHRDDVYIIKSKKDFTEKLRNLKSGVFITLPQTIKDIKKLGFFDLLVVDEAHQFYLAKMVKGIAARIKCPSLLLSATPFNLREFKYPEISYTLDKALTAGIMSNVRMEIHASCYDYDLVDYNQDDNLKSNTKLAKKQTYQTMDRVLKALVSKTLPKLEKTIIVAMSISHANYISNYLDKEKISNTVSHSKNDIENENIEDFRNSKSISVLIVVGRARLGFNMPELVNLVDISGSLNPSVLFQMLGRVSRIHPKGKEKRFLKLTPERLHEYTYGVMNIVACLSNQNFFENYSWGTVKSIPIPKDIYDYDDTDFEEEDDDEKEDKKYRSKSINLEDVIDVLNKIDYDAKKILDYSAYVTLNEIRNKLLKHASWTYELAKKEAAKYTSMPEWRKNRPNSYAWASIKKVQHKIGKELGWEIKKNTSWTYDLAKKEAAKYPSMLEWRDNSLASCAWASKNKVQNKIAKELGWEIRKIVSWTYDFAKKEAAKYSSMPEWRKKGSASCAWAVINKVQNKIAKELGWETILILWTYELAKKEAAKYSSKPEWRKNSRKSCAWAGRNKVQNKIAKELGWKMKKDISWTYVLAKKEAAKYSSLSGLIRNNSSCSNWVIENNVKHKLAKELGWKIKKKNTSWTYDLAKKEAGKCSSLSNWNIISGASYSWAKDKRVHHKIAKELGWEIQKMTSWTYELVKKEAAKYSSMPEWRKNRPNSCAWAVNNKVQHKIAKELGWEIRKIVSWTYDSAKKEAAKYSSIPEWIRKGSGSQAWAYKNKVHRKIATELKWKTRSFKTRSFKGS